jgi:uncharacterized protein DUF4124
MMRAAVFSILAVAIASASSATAQVYKCTQEGRVLYSDAPCKGGAIVDANGGAANPAAVRQLAHDNAAFDRKMAARRNAENIAAIRREEINAQRAAAETAQAMPGAAVTNAQYVDAPYGYLTPPRFKHRAHSHHEARPPQSRVPASPSPLTTNRNGNR